LVQQSSGRRERKATSGGGVKCGARCVKGPVLKGRGVCDARRHKEVIIVNRFAPKLNIYRSVWPALFRGASWSSLGGAPHRLSPINFGFWASAPNDEKFFR
jgi:hypothetical protein